MTLLSVGNLFAMPAGHLSQKQPPYAERCFFVLTCIHLLQGHDFSNVSLTWQRELPEHSHCNYQNGYVMEENFRLQFHSSWKTYMNHKSKLFLQVLRGYKAVYCGRYIYQITRRHISENNYHNLQLRQVM